MRILGIDPGFAILGWAVIEQDLRIIDYGVIETRSNTAIDERLLKIHTEITKIINRYQPECIAIERLFFAKNSKTALDVAKCIGVILLSIKLLGLDYDEYTPSQIKMALTGYGRASKGQIQNMVTKIFKIKKLPQPDDIADALAIAACHSFTLKN